MATKLQGKSVAELRAIARKLGINAAGKGAPDLIRLIQKAEKGAAGKGTAADPQAKPARGKPSKASSSAKGRVVVDDEEDDEEEEETPKKSKSAKSTAKPQKGENPIKQLRQLLTQMEAVLDGAQLDDSDDSDEDDDEEEETPKKSAKSKSKPKEDEDEDDEDDEEEEEEEEEEEDEAPKKSAKKSKSKSKDDDEEEEDEEDEEEEEDDEEEEDEEGLEFTPEELASMDLAALKKAAKKLNSAGIGGKVKIDTEQDSPRKLRQSITDFLNKYATRVEETPKKGGKSKKSKAAEDEDEDDDSDGEGADRPDFIRIGAKVECDLGDDDTFDWVAGAVETIDDEEEYCHVQLDDGTECDAPWTAMRPLNRRPRKR